MVSDGAGEPALVFKTVKVSGTLVPPFGVVGSCTQASTPEAVQVVWTITASPAVDPETPELPPEPVLGRRLQARTSEQRAATSAARKN